MSVPLFQDNELVSLFVEESKEYLSGIENDLLQLEAQGSNIDNDLVNKVFRSVHSIKGSAGCLNFPRIQEIAHALETLLSFIRDRTLVPLPRIVTFLLAGFDLLSQLVDSPANSNDVDVSAQLGCLESLIEEVRPKAAPPPPEIPSLLGEILIQEGVVEESDITDALAQQKKLGEILVEQEKATPEQINEALSKQRSPQLKQAPQTNSSIRVDTTKLDQLLNIVGEVVISQAHVTQLSNQLDGLEANELKSVLARLERDIRALQGYIMNIRMVPIGPVLHRYHRIVRDLSMSLNKQIDLVIHGEDTEIDKTIIEQLGDPLKHMIRNAIDHGIEKPEVRRAAGKPETGTVVLSAYHEGGSIVIEIADDGKGLAREAILQKAKKQGLIHEETLSDEQVFALIFHPGFSTAEKVTDVSGRGVGMDVVKKNIEALRGRIEIHSEEGQGSTFRLRLPLTMAIVDGLLVRIADSHYVLPLAQVEECVALVDEELPHDRHLFTLRGKLLPYVRLREFFHIAGEKPRIEQIAVVGVEGERIGLVVDEVVGDLQTVIKPLANAYLNSDVFSGATIMGNGEVALIVDVPNVARMAREEEASLENRM